MAPGEIIIASSGYDFSTDLTGTTSGNAFIVLDDTSGPCDNFSETLHHKEEIDELHLFKLDNIEHEQAMHSDKARSFQRKNIKHTKRTKMKHKKPHFTRRII